MSKFISFLSLEDRKGKDKFNVHRFVLFKVRGQISVVSYVLNNKQITEETHRSPFIN